MNVKATALAVRNFVHSCAHVTLHVDIALTTGKLLCPRSTPIELSFFAKNEYRAALPHRQHQ